MPKCQRCSKTYAEGSQPVGLLGRRHEVSEASVDKLKLLT